MTQMNLQSSVGHYAYIKRQFTTKYTPQQNGVAERKNITIMNMAKCMLKENNYQMSFGEKY